MTTTYKSGHNDSVEENRIAAKVAKIKGMTEHKINRGFGDYDEIDRYFYRNGKRCYAVEIKKRWGYKLSDLGSMIVDWRKMRALWAEHVNGLRAVVIQEFDDGIFSYELTAEWWAFSYVERGGRTKKYRGPKDIKPVCYIPRDKCKRIQ